MRLPDPTNMPTSFRTLKRKRCEGCGGGGFYCQYCACSVTDWPKHKATKKHKNSMGSSLPPPT